MRVFENVMDKIFWKKKVDQIKKTIKSQQHLSFEERNKLITKMYSLCKHKETKYHRDEKPDVMGNMWSYEYCTNCGKIGV